jgi:hypothetical protein
LKFLLAEEGGEKEGLLMPKQLLVTETVLKQAEMIANELAYN